MTAKASHDTQLLMNFFGNRTMSFAEETGASQVMAELALMALMTAHAQEMRG